MRVFYNMKKLTTFLWMGVMTCGSFFLGMAQDLSQQSSNIVFDQIQAEKAVVRLEKIEGDQLTVSLEGNVRITWSEEHFLDYSGDIFLGQMPDANDLQYRQYPFVGNLNTGKFYPSDTSWARGVRVKDRRFFATKEAAIAAGFIPTKSLQ